MVLAPLLRRALSFQKITSVFGPFVLRTGISPKVHEDDVHHEAKVEVTFTRYVYEDLVLKWVSIRAPVDREMVPSL